MPAEGNAILELFKLIDGFVGLAIAVWIINIGINRMDKLQQQSSEFVKDVLKQQQDNNDQLMGLVSTLCAQPTPQPAVRNTAKNS